MLLSYRDNGFCNLIYKTACPQKFLEVTLCVFHLTEDFESALIFFQVAAQFVHVASLMVHVTSLSVFDGRPFFRCILAYGA